MLAEKQGHGNMDIESLLTPKEGVYTITVRSEFNGFCQWYVIHIERAPDAEYQAPNGYVMVSSAENISTGGVAMSETYMPKMALDIQKLIIVALSEDSVPDSGPSSDVAVMTLEDMETIANSTFNIAKVFNFLLQKVGATGTVAMNSRLQGLYTSFGKLFSTPLYFASSLLSMKRITPQQMMGYIYSGLGLLLKQTGPHTFTLTDMVTVMTEEPEAVSADNIVSISTSYDYTRIPKTQTINFDTDGSIIQKSAASSVDPKELVNEQAYAAKGMYSDNLMHRASPGASVSQAVGLDAHILMQPVPLLAMVNLRSAIADENGCVEITVDGVTEKVKLSAIKKTRDSLKRKKKLSAKEKEWDYSAAIVTAKRMFMERLQTYMSFTVIQSSTAKNAVIDGAVGNSFGKVAFGGGEINLQKAVISSEGVKQVTETGNMDDQGFVTGLTVVLQAGITTSTITYINLSESYEGVF